MPIALVALGLDARRPRRWGSRTFLECSPALTVTRVRDANTSSSPATSKERSPLPGPVSAKDDVLDLVAGGVVDVVVVVAEVDFVTEVNAGTVE